MKASSTESSESRDLAIRFGRSMIHKTYQRKKKNPGNKALLGIVCEDDIVIKPGKSSKDGSKHKKKPSKTCNLSPSDDEPSPMINFLEESAKQMAQVEVVKGPFNSKHFESIGVLGSDFEILMIQRLTSAKKKVLEIKSCVDSYLNYDEDENEFFSKPYKIFLCVHRESKSMVGCLIAERITKAKRITFSKNDSIETSFSSSTDEGDKPIIDKALIDLLRESLSLEILNQQDGPLSHDDVLPLEHASLDISDLTFKDGVSTRVMDTMREIPSQKAVCGISRIWVDDLHRRKGIASKLLDTARDHMIFGYHLPRAYIAVTPFTPMGFKFIIQYLSRGMDHRVDSVLVY